MKISIEVLAGIKKIIHEVMNYYQDLNQCFIVFDEQCGYRMIILFSEDKIAWGV